MSHPFVEPEQSETLVNAKQIWCGSLINCEGGDESSLLVSSAARAKSTRISLIKANEPQVSQHDDVISICA